MRQPTNETPEFPPECEQAIRRFERAWQGPRRPEIEGHLPTPPPVNARLLLELIHVELDLRLRNGEPARVEEYLARFPSLTQDRPALLDLIAAEYALRRHWQPDVTEEEYYQRFPDDAEALRARLAAAAEGLSCPPPGLAVPTVPGYQVLRRIGRGGMGVVYLARQTSVGRVVALKVPGAASGQEAELFRREAETMARLDHPNIAPIYEVGEAHGCPYFSTKYYPGGSLADALRRSPGGGQRDHLRLVETVARAVHHAHQRGVLHRDLKPSNILIDEQGQPHVADFGLAKRFDPAAGGVPASMVVGTPGYIAPEVFAGSHDVTVASDVYGLGAVLYEALTGEVPSRADGTQETPPFEAKGPPSRPGLLNPDISRDLKTICLKCLEKDPARRYPTALELAEDLRRWLDGEPIQARPAGLIERAWRWARRHPAGSALALTAAASVLLTLVVLAVMIVQVRDKEKQTAEALRREQEANERRERLLSVNRVALAARLWSANHLAQLAELLDQCPPEHRRWAWHYLDARRRPWRAGIEHGETVLGLAYSPKQGRHLAVASRKGVRVYDVADGRPVHTLTTPEPMRDAVFSPNGRLLVAAGGSGSRAWHLPSAKVAYPLPASYWAAFSPDGRRIAVGLERVVTVHDAADGTVVQRFSGTIPSLSHGAFSPDGKHLAVGGSGPDYQGLVGVWVVATGKQLGQTRRYNLPVKSVAYSSDGKELLVAQVRTLVVTDAATGRLLHPASAIQREGDRARLALDSSGRFAYTDADWIVRVGSTRGGEQVAFRGQVGNVFAIAFRPDGKQLASAGLRGEVKIWDLGRPRDVVHVASPRPTGPGSLAFSDDGTRLASATGPQRGVAGAVVVLEASSGCELFRVPSEGGAAFGPKGRWLVTGQALGVGLWDKDGRHLRALVGLKRAGRQVAVSPDGRLIAAGDEEGNVVVWNVRTGKIVGQWRGRHGRVTGCAFSPDGAEIAAVGPEGGEVRSVDDTLQRRLAATSPMTSVAFSPKGGLLAVGMDAGIQLWDVDTGRLSASLTGHVARVAAVAFSPDGAWLASAGEDGTVRVWDVEFGQEQLSLPGVGRRADAVAVSPDGQRIVARDGAVKAWQGPVGE